MKPKKPYSTRRETELQVSLRLQREKLAEILPQLETKPSNSDVGEDKLVEVESGISLDQALQLFSYPDVEIPNSTLGVRLEQARLNPNSYKYAEILILLIQRYGAKNVVNKAFHMARECSSTLSYCGIEVSPYGKSVSWALWDIAKQEYYLQHPDETEGKYHDMFERGSMSPHNEQKMVDRHVGWEAKETFKNPVLRGKMLPKVASTVETYVRHKSKSGGSAEELSSDDLRWLGSSIRNTARSYLAQYGLDHRYSFVGVEGGINNPDIQKQIKKIDRSNRRRDWLQKFRS